jgi:hypothetical protein
MCAHAKYHGLSHKEDPKCVCDPPGIDHARIEKALCALRVRACAFAHVRDCARGCMCAHAKYHGLSHKEDPKCVCDPSHHTYTHVDTTCSDLPWLPRQIVCNFNHKRLVFSTITIVMINQCALFFP